MKITADPDAWLHRIARQQKWVNIALMAIWLLVALAVSTMTYSVIFLVAAAGHWWAATAWESIDPAGAAWLDYIERQHDALLAREAASHHVIERMKRGSRHFWLAAVPLIGAVFALALGKSLRSIARPPGVPSSVTAEPKPGTSGLGGIYAGIFGGGR